jgi:predicted HAD superfamily Cof-like phosphohydrolase
VYFIKRNYIKNQSREYTLKLISKYSDLYNKNPYSFYLHNLIDEVFTLAYIDNVHKLLPQLFQAVHESNMSKLDDNGKPIINDGILDPSKPIGKILKGKNYFEPRLKEILENGN